MLASINHFNTSALRMVKDFGKHHKETGMSGMSKNQKLE